MIRHDNEKGQISEESVGENWHCMFSGGPKGVFVHGVLDAFAETGFKALDINFRIST